MAAAKYAEQFSELCPIRTGVGYADGYWVCGECRSSDHSTSQSDSGSASVGFDRYGIVSWN